MHIPHRSTYLTDCIKQVLIHGLPARVHVLHASKLVSILPYSVYIYRETLYLGD